MSDLISRQAAIDAINGMPDCPNGYSDTYDKKHIIAVLEDAPSSQPEEVARDIATIIENEKDMRVILKNAHPQRWIPCSETVDIPEHSVLACDKYGEYIIGFLNYEDDQWLCESEHEYMYDAVAWMPLPEPYKGGESDA